MTSLRIYFIPYSQTCDPFKVLISKLDIIRGEEKWDFADDSSIVVKCLKRELYEQEKQGI